jgi:hypothetical protein
MGPRSDTKMALLFICRWHSYLTGNTYGPYGLLRRELYLLHVDDVNTSQETHLWASTAWYGDSFIYFTCKYICIYLNIILCNTRRLVAL